MSLSGVLSAVLVVIGTLSAIVAILGVELARGAGARLHFLAILTVLSLPTFALAAALAAPDPATIAKVLFIAALVYGQGPLDSHVIARALFSRVTHPELEETDP